MTGKPDTDLDFGERLRWMFLEQHNGWYLLCDAKTVSVPAYIKGKAKRTLYIGPGGYWREVVQDGKAKTWQFIDRPGQPITAKDYIKQPSAQK